MILAAAGMIDRDVARRRAQPTMNMARMRERRRNISQTFQFGTMTHWQCKAFQNMKLAK
jgi:hypothetical protein